MILCAKGSKNRGHDCLNAKPRYSVWMGTPQGCEVPSLCSSVQRSQPNKGKSSEKGEEKAVSRVFPELERHAGPTCCQLWLSFHNAPTTRAEVST